jgi:hypothetical protein
MIVLTAVVVSVGLIATFSAIGNAQMALGGAQADGARALAESCMEEVLLKINTTSSVPSTVNTPLGNCTVTTDAQAGSNYTVSVTATKDNRSKKITTSVSRTTTVSVTSWLEQN